jgi:hypothetical protein
MLRCCLPEDRHLHVAVILLGVTEVRLVFLYCLSRIKRIISSVSAAQTGSLNKI